MSLHGDLLVQARFLASKEPRRPLRASLRRGVSATYYALFHWKKVRKSVQADTFLVGLLAYGSMRI